ncbi:MAG: hypothetical protein IPO53_03665 [Chitinophagaceae bacterium]|nr:hypothetical protein [Chitinophagaceae bacterium]
MLALLKFYILGLVVSAATGAVVSTGAGVAVVSTEQQQQYLQVSHLSFQNHCYKLLQEEAIAIIAKNFFHFLIFCYLLKYFGVNTQKKKR